MIMNMLIPKYELWLTFQAKCKPFKMLYYSLSPGYFKIRIKKMMKNVNPRGTKEERRAEGERAQGKFVIRNS